jgi:hypothetical protein
MAYDILYHKLHYFRPIKNIIRNLCEEYTDTDFMTFTMFIISLIQMLEQHVYTRISSIISYMLYAYSSMKQLIS